jgi:(S)-2-hydroxyglutarate dehydrogenase
MKYDIAIVGAGIVGLATAYKLTKANPKLRIAVIEKEKAVGLHQTGNNSGVIHSGIYYKPGSLKAINCKKGYDELIAFAKDHGIAYDICGKIIVATDKSELTALDNIFKRGIENGLKGIRKITPDEVKTIEPHVKSVEAIWVPQTGIIDFPAMALKYAELIENQGHSIFFNRKVQGVSTTKASTIVHTEGGDIETKLLINCAGLHADALAKMTEPETDIQILPFRGEYYELKKEKQYLVKNLIYPVPNPNFPFLGVHFTRMIHGGIEAGPNAVLAFKREGYNRKDINFRELWATIQHPGFRKIAVKYWREGLDEMYRSYSKKAFVKALQKLIPEIQKDDVTEGGAGVRAQACDSKGNLIDDFLILEKDNIINVCNAPSPAATASLAIGETIAAKALSLFNKF